MSMKIREEKYVCCLFSLACFYWDIISSKLLAYESVQVKLSLIDNYIGYMGIEYL